MKRAPRLIALTIALAPLTGCGVAQRAGRGAAEGVAGTLARKAGDPSNIKQMAEGVGRRALGVGIDEISQPERLGDVQRIAAAIGAGAVSGAARAAEDGRLAATTEQLTTSMARGARAELSPVFPECAGMDAATCLDRAVERVSRASAAGVAAGIRESLGVWPIVLAFGAGGLSALALAWAWVVYRAHRGAHSHG